MLRDGSVAHVRPITPDDADGLRRFHAGQSDESIYLRFFAPMRELSDRDVYRFTHVDYVDRVALVATVRGEIIGIGRYDRIDADSRRGRLQHLRPLPGQGHRLGPARAPRRHRAGARRRAVHRRGAPAEPQDAHRSSRRRATRSPPLRGRRRRGVLRHPADRAVRRRSELSREHRAESRQHAHGPASPSSSPSSARAAARSPSAATCCANILAAGLPRASSTRSTARPMRDPGPARPTPSVPDVPEPVDLAVVAVPADEVLDVVDDCARGRRQGAARRLGRLRRGGRGRGAELQEELRRRGARRRACASSAPNSFGVINNDPAVRLNASLAPELPPPGRLGPLRAERRPRASPCSPRPPAAASASPSSPRPATASTSPATTSCSTGSTTRTPTRSASTSSRWATRASSPASPGGSPRPSRSSS